MPHKKCGWVRETCIDPQPKTPAATLILSPLLVRFFLHIVSILTQDSMNLSPLISTVPYLYKLCTDFLKNQILFKLTVKEHLWDSWGHLSVVHRSRHPGSYF